MNIDYLAKKISLSKMSISEIASKSKISRQTIYNLMAKSHYPELDTVLIICNVLELSSKDISIVLGIEGEK